MLGYAIQLRGDGRAVVISPKGDEYKVDIWDYPLGSCTCYNFVRSGGTHNGRCKHLIMVLQSYPCPDCGTRMALEPSGRYYECPNEHCRHSVGYDARLVTDDRKTKRQFKAA